MGPDEHHLGPIGASHDADALFERVYPAVVGLVLRVVDRSGRDRESQRLAAAEAVEVMVWARWRRLPDTDGSVARIAGRVLDRCVSLIEHRADRVPLPGGVSIEDLVDDDVLDDGAGHEWGTAGVRLDELHAVLAGADRRARRVGACVLAAGLPLEDAAALLDLRGDETVAALATVGERLTAHRRDAARVAASLGR